MNNHSEQRRRLGMRIAALRESNGLTQERLALMVGINRGYLSNIEQGVYSISFDKLCDIAGGLNMTLSELLKGVDAR